MAKRRLAYIRERDGYLYLCYREKDKKHKERLELNTSRKNRSIAEISIFYPSFPGAQI
jgi:hypothetical protein